MPTWGIVLSIVVYLGIGFGLASWANPDGEEMEPVDALVSVLWPIVIIGGIVSWVMDFMLGED